MNNELLIYSASLLLLIWGIARFKYSKSVVANYSDKTAEGNLILNMDLAAEGIGISLIGILALMVTIFAGSAKLGSIIIYTLAGLTLVFLSVWSIFSMNKNSGLTTKICPLIKLSLASFYFWAALISLN